jgi:hypothetical protein
MHNGTVHLLKWLKCASEMLEKCLRNAFHGLHNILTYTQWIMALYQKNIRICLRTACEMLQKCFKCAVEVKTRLHLKFRGFVIFKPVFPQIFQYVTIFPPLSGQWVVQEENRKSGNHQSRNLGKNPPIHRHSSEVAWWPRNNLLITIKLKNYYIFKIFDYVFWNCLSIIMGFELSKLAHIYLIYLRKSQFWAKNWLNVEFTFKTFVVSGETNSTIITNFYFI